MLILVDDVDGLNQKISGEDEVGLEGGCAEVFALPVVQQTVPAPAHGRHPSMIARCTPR